MLSLLYGKLIRTVLKDYIYIYIITIKKDIIIIDKMLIHIMETIEIKYCNLETTD